MTGKTITIIIVILLIIAGGFWYFGRDDGAITTLEGNGDATSENVSGTGGPEDDFDPLEEENMESKG